MKAKKNKDKVIDNNMIDTKEEKKKKKLFGRKKKEDTEVIEEGVSDSQIESLEDDSEIVAEISSNEEGTLKENTVVEEKDNKSEKKEKKKLFSRKKKEKSESLEEITSSDDGTLEATEDSNDTGSKKSKKKGKKEKKKWSVKKKVLVTLGGLFAFGVSSAAFLFYGPYDGFRNFWITSAMTTMSHQYLATWIYSDETIRRVLAENVVEEINEETDLDAIKIATYTGKTIYKNQYEKEVLTKDPGNDLYKVINISGTSYQGFLVVLYDPSKIHVATTSYLGSRGQDILTISQRENAIIAMNGGGFYDPDWNSNGAIPHGTVISRGNVVWDYADAGYGGGFICFTNENKLLLGRMDKNEAVSKGCRDAIEFGPFLIVNGKSAFIKGNGGWGIAPRTAIGQRKDGIVLMLVINGRLANSLGADMVDLTEIMERYGAYNAANLDGGSSSELVIKGEIINTPVAGGRYGLRDMSTFWVVTED